MKKYFIFLLITLVLITACTAVAQASVTTTISLSMHSAAVGSSVTVSGVSEPSTWIAVKIMDGSDNIVFFDAVKSDTNGNYSCIFVVPDYPGKTLVVIAGCGSNVASANLVVSNPIEPDIPPVTFDRESSSDDSGESSSIGSSSTPEPTPTLSISVHVNGKIEDAATALMDSETGTLTIVLNEDNLSNALEEAKADKQGIKMINIEIPKIEGANSYVTQLPTSLLAEKKTARIEIKTEIGTITVPGNMLSSSSAIGIDSVGLSIGAADTSGIDEEIMNLIGDKPVIELRLTSGGNTVSWNNPNAPVTVSIPYTPTEEELANPEHITIWYIDGSGNIVPVTSGKYNPDTGMVSFETTHFSKYSVTYVTKTFDDLESVLWAKKPIEVLTSKGIIRGISEKEFAPKENITRADFLYYLVRTLGVNAEFDENFDDISKDAYYYKEIGVAKALSITNGTGYNKFSPNASITRQDMIVMTERALRMLKKLKVQDGVSDIKRFRDKHLIAPYAIVSFSSVIKEGLIVGSGDKLYPLKNTTRAEAAVFLYRIYSKY